MILSKRAGIPALFDCSSRLVAQGGIEPPFAD